MGASQWMYFVPYQPDIEAALGTLRHKVFADGDYYKPDDSAARMAYDKGLFERGVITPEELAERLQALDPEPIPQTIEELIELRAEEGTHSILDIEGVADEEDYGVVVPLTTAQSQELLGTLTPSHEVIAAHRDELTDLYGRGTGVYVLAYRDGRPDEIFFGGLSGD